MKKFHTVLLRVSFYQASVSLWFDWEGISPVPVIDGVGNGEDWFGPEDAGMILAAVVKASGRAAPDEVKNMQVMLITTDHDELISMLFKETGIVVRFNDHLASVKRRKKK